MRSVTRLLIVALALALAVGVTAAGVAAKTGKTSKHHAGQACNPKKTPPKGFTCKKNSKGKYVLVKSK